MKEKGKLLPCVLIGLSLFLPVVTLVAFFFGYSVYLEEYHLYSVVTAVCFVACSWVLAKKNIHCGFLSFLPLFSFVSLAVCLFKDRSVFALICELVCFVCAAITAEKNCRTSKSKIASVITSMLLTVLTVAVSVLCVGFGNFGKNTVIKRIVSPKEEYYAEIIDSDQGALGGNTVVYVYKNSRLNLLVMTLQKTPEQVYTGEWGEYETMQIEWKNESSLLINSEEYYIDI